MSHPSITVGDKVIPIPSFLELPGVSKGSSRIPIRSKDFVGMIAMEFRSLPESAQNYAVRTVFALWPNAATWNRHRSNLLDTRAKWVRDCVRARELGKYRDTQSRTHSGQLRVRSPGAGRAVKMPDLREALFDWFVDVREQYHARIPRRMFVKKAESLQRQHYAVIESHSTDASLVSVFRFYSSDLTQWIWPGFRVGIQPFMDRSMGAGL